MNATQSHTITHETHAMSTGGAVEGFGAIATIALAIVGLAGVFSTTMAAIAAIVLGAAILFEGGSLEFINGRIRKAVLGEGLWHENAAATDLQGGVAAIVLGILALLGIASVTLLAVTLITVGAAFLFSGRFLSGLAGVVLGILAVVGLSPAILVLVGLLALGAGLLFTGSEMFSSTLTERRSP
jgi:hypothetical protein